MLKFAGRPWIEWLSHLSLYFTFFQTANLGLVFKDSSPVIPLIFVLSTGTDPAADLYKFAEEMRFSKKLSAISLGQGQVRAGFIKLAGHVVKMRTLAAGLIWKHVDIYKPK